MDRISKIRQDLQDFPGLVFIVARLPGLPPVNPEKSRESCPLSSSHEKSGLLQA